MQNVLIVAEMSINHNGDMNLFKAMIDSAWSCGIDFIKFQKYKTDEFMLPDNQHYRMFKDCELTDNEWLEIIKYCDDSHISYFFTPQNKTDLDFLEKFTKLTKIKIGSDDLTNLELIEYCAKRQRPMVISTGIRER
jgi:sialic acid synthase SpsE